MVTEEQIEEAAAALVFKWVFPTDTAAAPNDHTTAQAYILTQMLIRRMRRVAAEGKDPTGLSISELLPDLKPEEIVVEDGFF